MIRPIRKRRALTQEALAMLSGVPRVNITRYENGTTVPKVTDAIKIARALGVTVEELMRPENPEQASLIGAETPEQGRIIRR